MINKGERQLIVGIVDTLSRTESSLLNLAADAGSSPAVRAEVAATAGRLNAIGQMLGELIEGGGR